MQVPFDPAGERGDHTEWSAWIVGLLQILLKGPIRPSLGKDKPGAKGRELHLGAGVGLQGSRGVDALADDGGQGTMNRHKHVGHHVHLYNGHNFVRVIIKLDGHLGAIMDLGDDLVLDLGVQVSDLGLHLEENGTQSFGGREAALQFPEFIQKGTHKLIVELVKLGECKRVRAVGNVLHECIMNHASPVNVLRGGSVGLDLVPLAKGDNGALALLLLIIVVWFAVEGL